MDANHCPGSVMILFQGYFGTILHTGDMRFNLSMVQTNPILYPEHLRNSNYSGISIPIDEMILDNTFCDPIFKFPTRSVALKMIYDVIDKNLEINEELRVLICIDSLGKEEMTVELSLKYETLIIVSEIRYQMIRSIDLSSNLFTTDKSKGWIEIIRKDDRVTRLKEDKNCIAIVASGWANLTSYQLIETNTYMIPYSLHSNFKELEQFVRSIKPCILKKVVNDTSKDGEKK